MTEPSARAPGHVDLSTLTSGLHVLDVAPAWAAVERALVRLDSERASGTSPEDPQFKEDLQTVHEFHELLRRSSGTLALALLCGAVLGQAAKAESFGEKLLAGLRAISQGYGFDRLVEHERKGKLKDLLVRLKDEGLVTEQLSNIPAPVEAFSRAGWSDWCQGLRKGVEESANTDHLRTEQSTFRKRAWSAWRDRLAPQPRLDRATWPRLEPVLADLVCAAAGVSPANRLDLDLGRMNLVAWSEVVFWALVVEPSSHPQVCPSWSVAPALYMLGFRPHELFGSLTALVHEVSSLRKSSLLSLPDENMFAWLGQWEGLFERGPRGTQPAILLIRRAEDSLVSTWKSAKPGGVLALTQDQLAQLTASIGMLRPNPLEWIRPVLVVLEAPRDEPRVNPRRLVDLIRRVFSPDVLKLVLLARDSSVKVSEDFPVILGARNADELAKRARPFLARSAS